MLCKIPPRTYCHDIPVVIRVGRTARKINERKRMVPKLAIELPTLRIGFLLDERNASAFPAGTVD